MSFDDFLHYFVVRVVMALFIAGCVFLVLVWSNFMWDLFSDQVIWIGSGLGFAAAVILGPKISEKVAKVFILFFAGGGDDG